MKNYIFLAFSLAALTWGVETLRQTTVSHSPTEMLYQTDYCEGWEDGHCEGWKDVKGQYAICPVTPICPIPKIECNEGYKCGYNRGFKKGMHDAKEQS
jgi:hypothetical protein